MMMYSLYRAWLMRDVYSSTLAACPPDAIIQVGPTLTQFSAHRSILSAHSGYFKSIINGTTIHPLSRNIPAPTQEPPLPPILIPNIGVQEFTSLLTFMYTGYLDLNMENIYNILLATHILHMPTALEICRNFLVQNNNQLLSGTGPIVDTETPNREPLSINATNVDYYHPQPQIIPPTIVKPIPSRKMLPEFLKNERIERPDNPPENVDFSFNSNYESFQKLPKNRVVEIENKPKEVPFQPANEQKPSTSKDIPLMIKRRRPSTMSETSGSSCDDNVVKLKIVKKPKRKEIPSTPSVNTTKAVIDIACCDGPVRFHRVLNSCYGLDAASLPDKQDENTVANRTYIMNKFMTENINSNRDRSKNFGKMTKSDGRNDRRGRVASAEKESSGDLLTDGSENDVVYTCIYCNHTFKSQYCYQKHAKRHINPMVLTATSAAVFKPSSCQSSEREKPTDRQNVPMNKREAVKLLDMNVQYYPCKTCGSKFPSYYFVHKHRKLHHADEESGNSTGNTNNNSDEKEDEGEKRDGNALNVKERSEMENEALKSGIERMETDEAPMN